jgi:hypothetical protein
MYQLAFDDIIMGLTETPSFTDGLFSVISWQGFNNLDVNLNTYQVPRTDYYQNLNSNKTQSVKTITGKIHANSAVRMVELIEKLAKYHNQSKTFIIKRFVGGEVYKTANFTGLIKSILFEGQVNDNSCPFILSIVCDDPYFYDLVPISQTKTFTYTGFIYPIVYPIVYGNQTNLIEVNNTGNTPATPIWKIKNQITNPLIINTATNQVFNYSQNINDGRELVIDTKMRTAKIAGTSKLQFITNLDQLILPVGISRFSFSGSGITESTQIEVSFYPKSNII